jgi:hypothetical protein
MYDIYLSGAHHCSERDFDGADLELAEAVVRAITRAPSPQHPSERSDQRLFWS